MPTKGLLFVVDGGSGWHVHKWANIKDALGKDARALKEAKAHFWNMRKADNLARAEAHAIAREAVLQTANLFSFCFF